MKMRVWNLAAVCCFLGCIEAWIPILLPRKSSSLFSATKGFGKRKGPQRKKTSSESIYSMPALYDLAFGYRSYEAEVDFLLDTHERYSGFPCRRILELAAGPGRHSLTALSSMDDFGVSTVTCLDTSNEMAEYSKDIAKEIIDQDNLFSYEVQDMRKFDLPNQTFDSAWILLGSMQHLLTNQEVVDCLRCINQHLQSEGTLIIELPHPRETLGLVECTRNEWSVPLEDDEGQDSGELKILWGDEDDILDPLTQVRDFTVEMKLTPQTDEMHNVRQVVSSYI